jgi:hypothetical protein
MTAPARLFLGLLALCTGATSLAAAPHLPDGSDSADAIAMDGPYASLADYCKASGDDVDRCLAPPTACGATRGVGKLAGAFAEARVLAGCGVALRAAKGWYVVSTAGLPAWASFLHNGDRYLSEIGSIAPSADKAAVLVTGTFIHATTAQKMLWLDKAPEDGWYECEQRLFVCRIGDAGPSCAGPFPLAFTAYCRDGEHPERALRRAEPHDFRFTPELQGTTLTLRAASPRQPREAPLPGWAVVAIDAPRLVDVRRALPPEHVALHFP